MVIKINNRNIISHSNIIFHFHSFRPTIPLKQKQRSGTKQRRHPNKPIYECEQKKVLIKFMCPFHNIWLGKRIFMIIIMVEFFLFTLLAFFFFAFYSFGLV